MFNVFQKRVFLAKAHGEPMSHGLTHSSAGISAEVAKALDKHWRMPERKEEVMPELRSIMAHVASMCTEMGVFMSEVMPAVPYSLITEHNPIPLSRKLVVLSGEILGLASQADQSDAAMNDAQKSVMIEKLGEFGVALHNWCRIKGVSLTAALTADASLANQENESLSRDAQATNDQADTNQTQNPNQTQAERESSQSNSSVRMVVALPGAGGEVMNGKQPSPGKGGGK